MSTPKPAGFPCPNCGEPFCAEYVPMGGAPRWRCSCGAEGLLTGSLDIRSKSTAAPAPASQGPRVFPHWSQREGG